MSMLLMFGMNLQRKVWDVLRFIFKNWVSLLADVFEYFRSMYVEYYGLQSVTKIMGKTAFGQPFVSLLFSL